MNKAITILILALFATSAFGAACTGNDLADEFEFTILDTDIASQAFEFCTDLQADGAKSCCSAATVNGFQDMADALLDDLSDMVADRDINLISLRNSALTASSAFDRIAAAVTKLSGGQGGMEFNFGGADTMFESFIDDLADSIEDFTGYQEARTTCVKFVTNIQAAAWCLACADQATVSNQLDSGVGLDSDTYDDLIDACYPFIQMTAAQSAAVAVYYYTRYFDVVATAIEKLANGDLTGIEDLMENIGDLSDPTIQADDISKLPVQSPDGCTALGCTWLTSTLLVNGVVDWKALAAGGEVQGEVVNDESRRRLPSRKLQSGAWGPSQTSAGITVTFEDNPGDVDAEDTSSSAFRTGVIASILALFALLF